jgi:tight adherence protein C
MTPTTLLLLSAFFVVVVGGIVAGGYFLVLRPAARRANEQEVPDWARGADKKPPVSPREHIASALQQLGEAVPRKDADVKPALRQLIAAGYRTPNAIQIMTGAKIASSVLMAILLGWLGLWWLDDKTAAVAMALACGAIGYLIPERVLDVMITNRNYRLRSGLPAALDLWALGIEASQPLDQSIADSSRELARVYPDLSFELGTFQMELRAGKSRIEVLEEIGVRNREPELKKVCKLLIDGDRFGTSLAPALRNHAKYMRLRSRQKAQESARKVGVKLIFPVFFLIFPSVILITLGPAVIQISTMFENIMQMK